MPSWTELHKASLYGPLERVQELIDAGADVNAKEDSFVRQTPPKIAAVLIEVLHAGAAHTPARRSISGYCRGANRSKS